MSTITFDVSDIHDAIEGDRALRVRGGRSLHGEVRVRGAKNTLPKSMVAALLTDQECLLRNVSGIRDVEIVGRMIRALGGDVEHTGSGEIRIHAADLAPLSREEAAEFSGRSRIPVLLCGPLLNRVGELFIPDLGGCNIGPRPIDFHLEALTQLGAVVHESTDGVRLTAERLHGAKIRLPYPSVGATEQVLLSAVLAEGVTELSGAAIEPEIIDLIAVLQKMGATISVETDRVITINGVERMHGFEHSAMPDRLETASWACAALATDGRIFVSGAHQLDMMTFLNAFRRVGGDFHVSDDGIEFWRSGALRSVVLETDVHPGFMTDWQQPLRDRAHTGRGRLDRARDRVRGPLRLHRRAGRHGRPRSSSTASAWAVAPAASASATIATAPSSSARRRCAAPRSTFPICAQASPT